MSTRPSRPDEHGILEEIIATVSSSLDLDEVLAAVVRLLTHASAVHACFVYLPERHGERLVLRAATEPYTHLVERVTLEPGQGVAGWAFEHRQPVFLRENALADERMHYVPELEEERFQSLVCVPLSSRRDAAVGVIVLHTEAPREFTDGEAELLTSVASLVAGAIENARLYEEVRERLRDLELLTELAERIARAPSRDELLETVAGGARRLLRASACHLYVVSRSGDELALAASAPTGAVAPAALGIAQLGPEIVRTPPRLALPMVSHLELLGLLVAEGATGVGLGRAIASHVATAIEKLDLIERLAERNLIHDFFVQLESGLASAALEDRARRLGISLSASFVVVHGRPASDELERALELPGTLVDRGETSVRALVRLGPADEHAIRERLTAVHAALATPAAIGVSSPCAGAESFRAALDEAERACAGAALLGATPGVLPYEELGPYKYLLRLAGDDRGRDRHCAAVARVAEYDRAHSAQLLRTLEEFLARRGNVKATADAIFVHQNTLRQRLRRIEAISGLDLRAEDWLLVEMAVKLVKLDIAGPPRVSDPSVPPAPRAR